MFEEEHKQRTPAPHSTAVRLPLNSVVCWRKAGLGPARLCYAAQGDPARRDTSEPSGQYRN